MQLSMTRSSLKYTTIFMIKTNFEESTKHSIINNMKKYFLPTEDKNKLF